MDNVKKDDDGEVEGTEKLGKGSQERGRNEERQVGKSRSKN